MSNNVKLHHKPLLVVLLAVLLTLPGWGAGRVSAETSSPACGTGDHGLLTELQNGQAEAGASPLVFSDIQFLNDHTGRAAGNGFLIGTSDGGCNFQKIYQGQWSFKQIDFPDNVRGWALASVQDGIPEYLIKTTDGGTHWKRVSSGAVSFETIDFMDGMSGFGYNRGSTYRTVDGGAHWSKVPTPANTRGAYFSSIKEGWAVVIAPGAGYRLMKTINGGTTWSLSLKAAFDDPEYGQIYAKGNQVWAVLYGGSGMSQTSYSLYASSNKGSSWERVIAQDTAGGGPAPGSAAAQVTFGPANGKPGNMQLVGSGSAYLVGFSPAAEKVAVGRSLNGGRVWSNLPSIRGFEGRISFTSDKVGWLALRKLGSSEIYTTTDGGSTWKLKLSLAAPENP
ncbi:hypothetical protein [Paenibacillus sp. sgz500958]|uniref:hypothetical protein n=1 Tax=Paenibacillus sp. sgz500958 TaxID=3242475 RepID=UPI0036D22AF7